MRLLYGVLLAAILSPGLGFAQTDSQSTPAPAEESGWLSKNPLKAPGAAAKGIGKIFKRVPTTSSKEAAAETTGPVAFVQVQSNTTPLGGVFILDADVGYAFTPHFTLEGGVPLIFDRSPFSEVTTKDWRWTTWLLGDPYVDIRYSRKPFGGNFMTVLTGTFPVSNPQRVFTTGRFNGDWFNHLDKSFKWFTPFLNAGASNGTVNRFIMPRPYNLARPYQTLGFMSDFEGGASFRLAHGFSIGGSAYALVPGGPQKVFSRLVAPDFALAGDGAHNRYFDSAFETVGPSRIARDNGYSGWLEVARIKHVNLQVGYTHSVHYAYDSLTVMFNFDGSFLFKPPQEQ
ncbi:MAG: hypothetical protein LAP13_21680 [Acidobacteriia bacterium]|nr:hypothetical protein [Terriglobia bacterium]